MKKLLLVLVILISSFAITASAEENSSCAEVHTVTHDSPQKRGNRKPARLPIIFITSDSETRTIEVSCDDDYEVVVWLFDAHGNVVDSSDVLNTILYAPNTGDNLFHVRIESYNWYATANISF